MMEEKDFVGIAPDNAEMSEQEAKIAEQRKKNI